MVKGGKAVAPYEWHYARDIAKDVTSRVVSAVGVRPAQVVVLGPGSLPKTPSGKLRRAATVALLASRS